MIVRDPNKDSWFRLLFSVQGSALARIWPRLAIALSVSLVVTVIQVQTGWFTSHKLTVLPFSLIGVALGIFLGFRNNTSYDRFWEGRKLWGSIVNESRTLCRRSLTLIKPRDGDSEESVEFKKELVRRTAAYVHALRLHLRNEISEETLSDWLPQKEASKLTGESNPPIAVLHSLGERFREAYDKGWLHAYHLPLLEETLAALTAKQGGCERIKSTPIPFAYTVTLHRIVACYCFLLPFGIVNQVNLLTPLVAAMVSYAFFSLDAIGEEIEEPFGKDLNDLPLTAITTMIERNIKERLEGEELPELKSPVGRILQ